VTRTLPCLAVALALAAGCGDEAGRRLGQTCDGDSACASGLCYESVCLDPSADTDGDGVSNRQEIALGRNPFARDSTGPDASGSDGASGSGDSDGSGQGGPPVAWMLLFDPNVDLGACGDAGNGLRSATAFADPEGALTASWPGGAEVFATGTGAVDAEGFTLSFACASGGATSGTLSADPVRTHYEGTWSFDGGSGLVMVARSQHSTFLVEGHVMAMADATPIAGALVGTSLDAATITTDATGHFFLETLTPLTRGSAPFTIGVTRAGFQPLSREVSGERVFGLGLGLASQP